MNNELEVLINLGGNYISERNIKKNNILYSSIILYTVALDIQFKERLYLYYIQQLQPNKCKMCDNKVSLNKNIKNGYKTYCSIECSRKDSTIYSKMKATNKERYGFENVAKSPTIKNKTIKTNQERYGTDHYIQTKDFKEKSAITQLDKYGSIYQKTDEFRNIAKNNIDVKKLEAATKKAIENDSEYYTKIQNKIVITNMEKYGVTNTLQLDVAIKNKRGYHNNINNLLYTDTNIQYISRIDYILTLKHNTCLHTFNIHCDTYYQRKSNNHNICTICNPITHNKSIQEDEVYNFLLDNNINCIRHNKDILDGKELDLYNDVYNIAIEYNGLYWHSEQYKDSMYHRNKYDMCIEKNIDLVHIFEDDWVYKKDIVKSILLNKFNKIENRIYSRKCDIRKVNSNTSNSFLDNNHIQGKCKSTIKYGLYYNNELVSLMTFGTRNINNKKEFELIRFCNKLNTVVIGSASKIFKHFLKENNNINNIIC